MQPTEKQLRIAAQMRQARDGLRTLHSRSVYTRCINSWIRALEKVMAGEALEAVAAAHWICRNTEDKRERLWAVAAAAAVEKLDPTNWGEL